MRDGKRLLAIAAAVAAASASALVAGPAGAQGLRAHWALDEVGSPPPVATDDSGNGNNGVPAGGVVGNGSAYTFDGTGRVVVPDAPSLNPGITDFSYSVSFTTTVPPVGNDFDLLRKGFTKTSGGEYKAEILDVNGAARAFCLVKDSQKHIGRIRFPKGDLADGNVHTITCSKTSTGLTITVDGFAPRTRTVTGGLGSVSNSASVILGAKTASGGDDFIGSLLDVSIS
jgi:hypothetical protein